MTPIELAEPDDRRDQRGRRDRSDLDSACVSRDATGVEGLYGSPQHEVGYQPDTQKEALYGEPQHESVDECRWGEPFPWLLEVDDDTDRRPTTRSRTDVPLRRLGRRKSRTRR